MKRWDPNCKDWREHLTPEEPISPSRPMSLPVWDFPGLRRSVRFDRDGLSKVPLALPCLCYRPTGITRTPSNRIPSGWSGRPGQRLLTAIIRSTRRMKMPRSSRLRGENQCAARRKGGASNCMFCFSSGSDYQVAQVPDILTRLSQLGQRVKGTSR